MMSGIRGRDTQPEVVLRRGLFSRGVRFRLHVASLPGRPDIVIRKRRVVLLVHGCFWHAHQGCRFFRYPESNRQFWIEKLDRNRERDLLNTVALQEEGWRVAVVWECAIRANPKATLDLLSAFVESENRSLEVGADPAGRISADYS